MVLTEADVFGILIGVLAFIFIVVPMICYILTRTKEQRERDKKLLRLYRSCQSATFSTPSETLVYKGSYINRDTTSRAVETLPRSKAPGHLAADPVITVSSANMPRPGSGDVLLVPPAAPPDEIHI